MSVTDTRSPNLNFQVPVPGNNLADDVMRLAALVLALDSKLAAMDSAIVAKVSPAALTAYQASAERNVANGYAGLNSLGQIENSAIPQALLGGLIYKGGWNATSNVPAVPAASGGNKGWFYVVAVAGSTLVSGNNDWQVGDWLVSNGTSWDKVDNTDRVSAVAGKTGSVTLVADDISDASANGKSLLKAADFSAMRTLLSLGSAALLTAGTAANQLVQLDASAKLPALDGSALSNIGSPVGSVVAFSSSQTGAVATGTTVIPLDDTIPQKTEGTQFMAVTHTPKAVGNKLKIDVVLIGDTASYTPIVAALFKDADADAIAAAAIDTYGNSGIPNLIAFRCVVTVATVAATTFSVRAGPASADTLTVNGVGGARRFGGAMASSITVTEIKA